MPELAIGDIVSVRSRQYLVESVTPPPASGDSTLVSLSCLEDDALGEPLSVLWEREIDAHPLGAANWELIAKKGFDEPRLFSAYLHALRWNCVTATDPKLFQSPYRAGIEVKAYQLEPLYKALKLPRVNLFIADDVGLGKTIEAGLILRELLMRQKVRRTVICCPPSVVRQWRDEMEQRFGLSFIIFDREFVAQKRRERGYGVNAWRTHSRFIISQALIRDEQYTGSLRDWLGGFSAGSLLILDEAHNAAPASGARYAVDSRLTRTVRDLAPRFEHRLFLSATPHNGHSNSFSALLEILDPQRFCRGVPVRSKKLRDAVMVRRLKKDLRGLEDDFPERKVVRVELGGLPEDSAELLLSRLLQQYRALKEKRLEGLSSTRRASAMLVVTSLQKRLLSSVEAFAHTLAVHRRGMVGQARQVLETGLLLDQPDMDDERAELTEEEVQAEEDAQVAAVTAMAAPGEEERALLDRMAEIAGSARYEPDSRIRWLKRWIEDNLIAGTSWRNRRVIIFTDYADSKRYLVEQLRGAIAHTERASERIDTFHGGMGEDRRESIKQAFNAAPEQHPLRILIATDAAREGVNLQNHCADLVHFDIPWNPSKMEQRNGRIDRKLQREKEVRCYYFVLPQRAEDRVLDVLVEKTGRIREELGSLSTVVERKVSSLLQQGIREEDAERLKQSLERLDLEQSHKVIQEELEESRQREDELKGQLETLHKVLKASRDYIGLDERHFLDSLSASLELLGTGGLKVVDEGRGSFEIPALHQRLGADPTWAVTLDSLRTPAKKGQKLWEWRKEAPLRRVVFHDPGTLDGELVHLHLEHRLVKRLLGRFMAQGFLHHQLSRGCVLRTEDPVPRVVVIGRLSLYGTDASRLHDEVIAVAAEWTDPQRRGRGKLKPLPEVGRDETLRLLEESLANPRLREVSATVRERLGESAPRDVEDLLAALEQRAAQLASRAEVALKRRGDQEAADMASILESQQKRILAERDRVDKERAQGLLGFMVEEIRQIEADARHWEARLRSLAAELETEPERIRATYRVKATRVEPVGLVYLWPVSG